jgi:hypothetical protein
MQAAATAAAKATKSSGGSGNGKSKSKSSGSSYKKASGSSAKTKTAPFTSGQYNNFVYNVGMCRSDSGRANRIVTARKQGKISDKQVQTLCKKFGLKTK